MVQRATAQQLLLPRSLCMNSPQPLSDIPSKKCQMPFSNPQISVERFDRLFRGAHSIYQRFLCRKPCTSYFFLPLFLERALGIKAESPRLPASEPHQHLRPATCLTISPKGFNGSTLGKRKGCFAETLEVVGAADEALPSFS